MKRVAVPAKMARKLYELNANSCCVCKRTGVGLNLHHIDGDSSNTTEENLAVICVKDHDAHHRPNKYTALNHMDLSAERLHAYKTEWEEFVRECKKNEPQVLATINAFGTYENIVGIKVVFQWSDGRIVFERVYQQLDGDIDYWTDKAIEEVMRFGKNIKIVLIDEPLKIDYDGNELLLSDVMGTEEDTIYQHIEKDIDHSLLQLAMSKLSRREQTIVELRFGLKGREERTQKEVADLLGISQSYISRLEKKIISRLQREFQKLE